MDHRSVFFDEWIRSLREQYKHVVRRNDKVTLPTLTAVMQNVGFSEDELTQLRIEATMHVDDVGKDFVADINALPTKVPAQAHPAECSCPQCVTIDESLFDAEGQPLAHAPERALHVTGSVFPVATLEENVAEAESELLTFEDSLDIALDGTDEMQDDAENSDDPKDDAEKPLQMSLF